MKHTPGPWFLSQAPIRANANKIAFLSIKNKQTIGGRIIANAFMGVNFTLSDKHKEELTANAKLIAAAPELLEALQKLLSVAPSLPDSWETPFDEELREALIKSTNAIKKTTT